MPQQHKKDIETISQKVDESSTSKHGSNRPRTHSHGSKSQVVHIQPPIPEVLAEEDDGEVKIIENNNSLRTSFIKKPPSRTNSMNGVRIKIPEVRSYENVGFDEKMHINGGSHFRRDDSGRSSTHESIQSLPVQREQYCCFSKWSPFEKRLATSIAVLAGIIVALVIAVGLLAGDHKGVEERFIWKP